MQAQAKLIDVPKGYLPNVIKVEVSVWSYRRKVAGGFVTVLEASEIDPVDGYSDSLQQWIWAVSGDERRKRRRVIADAVFFAIDLNV